MNAPVQQATIRQYAKQLQLRTIGGQFAEVAEQAVRQKQSHLSYLEALLGGGSGRARPKRGRPAD
jgi:hypothetical protein